jgi:hypothetical protein
MRRAGAHCFGISLLLMVCLIVVIALVPEIVACRVVRVEIGNREIVSTSVEHGRAGPYEVIRGIIYLEVDPQNPANRRIVDLMLAPRNSRGNVEFSTEFELHKPVDADRGNHRLLYFVNNRGHKGGAGHFNHLAGKNWLYDQGWSYLWCGWGCDVEEGDQNLNISVPIATEKGKAITGKIYAELVSYANGITYSQPIVWGGSIAYPPVDMDQSQASLTMRQYRWTEPVEIPRDQWEFARWEKGEAVPDPGFIYIKQGFRLGWLYDLVYIGKNPKVTGLGLAAVRDVVSFFKYEKVDEGGLENPLADRIDYAYAWGHSQSARFLNHFLYQDFNGDERQRMVFNGLMANCPGAGKGLFNSRFAQTTRHGSHLEDNLFPIDFFPFSTVEQYDPITGERGDELTMARRSGFLPKVFFINSSTDYWTRAASLLHTDVEGKKDAAIDPNVRIYSIAGIAHTQSRIGIIGRALLVALDQWVSHGVEPPASQIPRISDGTLVDLEAFRKTFPDIPGVLKPDSYYHPYRLDMGARWRTEGIADNVPPKAGPRFVCLIPRVDEDGNEMAGIRLPEVAVPLATFTGWSMRSPLFSRTLRRNEGAVWRFPVTVDERRKSGDPRKSILERYPEKMDYLSEVAKHLLHLRQQRFLLDEDVSMLLEEAAEQDYWPVDEKAALVSIEKVEGQPLVAMRGESITLIVRFKGQSDDVVSVKAVVREAPQNFYVFNDDGRDGDGLAGDNVWTTRFDVVPDAVPGEYHLDIHAFDKNWNPIFLSGSMKDGWGEIGSIIGTVK